jgi:hypothetical protein
MDKLKLNWIRIRRLGQQFNVVNFITHSRPKWIGNSVMDDS